MTIRVRMPNGASNGVNEKAVLTIRPATSSERQENPQVLTTIWTGGAKLYPAETLDALFAKFSPVIALAALTAPNGTPVYVSMASVVDADPPGPRDASATQSILYFDSKPGAPRQGVREDFDRLRALWSAAGLPVDLFA